MQSAVYESDAHLHIFIAPDEMFVLTGVQCALQYC